MENKYQFTFLEALKDMFENSTWYKGDDFAEGMFIKLNDNGVLVSVNAKNFYSTHPIISIKALNTQKFRIVRVATLKELSY